MGSTLLEGIAEAPVNTAVICFCSVLWFYMWNKRMQFDNVSISYNAVVNQRQYYRIVTAAFVHANFLHIVFNMASLSSAGMLEAAFGHVYYIKTSILLLFVSKFIFLAVTHVAVKRFGRTTWAEIPAVGYSAVIFGWMTVMSMFSPSGSISLPLGFNLPYTIAPFISLFVTQLIVPRASFLGHFAGIVAGYLISLGAFDWLSGYWFWSSLVYAALALIISLRANPSIPFVARFIQVSPEFMNQTGLGGTREDLAGAGSPQVRRYMENGVLRVFRQTGDDDNSVLANEQQPSIGQRLSGVWNYIRRGGNTRAYSQLDAPHTATAAHLSGDTGGTQGRTSDGTVAAPAETVGAPRAQNRTVSSAIV